MRELLEKLVSAQALKSSEINEIFTKMLGGQLSEAETGAILASWRIRGERAAELAIGARQLRALSPALEIPASVRPLVDNCGTGGDGSGSFNISTAAAIVAAAAGARVAKHGNKQVSSRCGSADLLFEAGFPQTLSPENAGRLLTATGLTFFFAPNHHPAVKQVAGVRKALGIRTIFNLLGPLANPAAPEYQIVGVGAAKYMRPIAESLAALGTQKALVLHSRDGLDEISPAAVTDAVYLENGRFQDLTINPQDFGLKKVSLGALAGGDAAYNVQILYRILGGEKSGVADTVALNAAAVVWLHGCAPTLEEGLEMTRACLSRGKAEKFMNFWIKTAQQLM